MSLSFLNNLEANELVFFGLFALIIIFLIKNLFLSYFTWWQQKYINNLQVNISSRLYSKYLYQPYSFFLDKNSAELVRNVNNEVARLSRAIMYFVTLLTESLVLIFLTLLILLVDPLNGMLISSILILSALIYNYALKDYFVDWGKERLHQSALVIKNLLQGFGAIKQLKLSSVEEEFLIQFKTHQKKIAKANILSNSFTEMPRLWLEFIGVLALVIIIFTLLKRSSSPEEILPVVAFFGASAFRILPSIKRILQAAQKLKFNFPATDLIFRELNSTIKEENNSYHNSENLFFQKNIEANNISFKFPKSEKFLFQDISLKIYKNEAIGIYGETGAGKSTLIDILTGILKPSDGSVLCDNQEIEKNIKSWQSRIGYVPQEIFLIDDSIINNIAFGIRKEKINLKRINEVIKLSQLENFINTLPRGAETKVGERGIKLSGGQKQRIGIARALYKNPDLLIFDEATSSLDENTEKKIIETINSFKQKKTMIIISHRIVTLKNCDRTYKIENSKLIEQRV